MLMKFEKNNIRLLLVYTILWLAILFMSCNRQQSYGYWNGIYQPPPQEIDDYEKP